MQIVANLSHEETTYVYDLIEKKFALENLEQMKKTSRIYIANVRRKKKKQNKSMINGGAI